MNIEGPIQGTTNTADIITRLATQHGGFPLLQERLMSSGYFPMKDLRVMARTGCETGVELFPQSSIYGKTEGFFLCNIQDPPCWSIHLQPPNPHTPAGTRPSSSSLNTSSCFLLLSIFYLLSSISLCSIFSISVFSLFSIFYFSIFYLSIFSISLSSISLFSIFCLSIFYLLPQCTGGIESDMTWDLVFSDHYFIDLFEGANKMC